jgi:hypothetical protein
MLSREIQWETISSLPSPPSTFFPYLNIFSNLITTFLILIVLLQSGGVSHIYSLQMTQFQTQSCHLSKNMKTTCSQEHGLKMT